MLGLLIFVLVVVLVAAVLIWLVDMLPAPHPIGLILKVLIVIIAILAILQKFVPLAGVDL